MSDVITLSSDEDECPSPKRRKLNDSGQWRPLTVSKRLDQLLEKKVGSNSSSVEQANNKRDFSDILKHIHRQGVQVSTVPKNQNRVNLKKLQCKEVSEHNFTIVIHDEGPAVNSLAGRTTNKANVVKPKCKTKPTEELITIIINDESPVKKSRSVNANEEDLGDANDDVLEVKEMEALELVTEETTTDVIEVKESDAPSSDNQIICQVEEINPDNKENESTTKITDIVVGDDEKVSSSPVVVNEIVPETGDDVNADRKPSDDDVGVICVVEAVEGNVLEIGTGEEQKTLDKNPENADEKGPTPSAEPVNGICDLIEPKNNHEELLVKTLECPIRSLEDSHDELLVKTSEGPVRNLEDNHDELLVKTFEDQVSNPEDNPDDLPVETIKRPVSNPEDNQDELLLVKAVKCPVNNTRDDDDELLVEAIEGPVNNTGDNHGELLVKAIECPVSNPEDNHDELLVKTSECPIANPEDKQDEVLGTSSECPNGNAEDNHDELQRKTSESPISIPEDDEVLGTSSECPTGNAEDNHDELQGKTSESPISIPEDNDDEPQAKAIECPVSNPEDNNDDSSANTIIESPISNEQGKENNETDSAQLQEEYDAIEPDPVASTSSAICNNNNDDDAEKFAKHLDEFLETVSDSIKDTSYETKILEKFPKIRTYFDNCKHLSRDSVFLDTIKEATNKAKVSAPNAVVKFSFLYKYLRESMCTETEDIPKEVRSKVRKLERFMILLNKKIKKLDEAEVDWSDDENSPYVKQERYLARFNKVHAKYCQLLKKNPHCGRPTHDKITFAHSKYAQINQAITKFCKHNKFPTYRDIETVVKKCTKKYDLPLSSESSTKVESKLCFEKLGNLLQSRRKRELYDSHSSFITLNEDPATHDAELDRKLKSSAQDREGKLKEIMEKYVRLQEKNVDVALSSEDSEDNSNHEESSSDAADQVEV